MGLFDELAKKSIGGNPISPEEALAVLNASDEELEKLLAAAFKVRREIFGTRVKLVMLRNARSGLCGEDCHYCSQSSLSKADIPRYGLEPAGALVAGARLAVSRGARRYCMVISGRQPTSSDISELCAAASSISREFPELELCVSPGLIGREQALRLKESGVGWINHNLNTSSRFHPRICSTHSYEDRLATVEAVRDAGLRLCCGGIVGMGESEQDVVDLALSLSELKPESLPVNFLLPIPGTPLSHMPLLPPKKALKALCLFRFASPASDLRSAAGRERILGSLQVEALKVASSIFIDGYLTTPGEAAEQASAMVRAAGFTVE